MLLPAESIGKLRMEEIIASWTGLELQDFPLPVVFLFFSKFKVNKKNKKMRLSKSIQ